MKCIFILFLIFISSPLPHSPSSPITPCLIFPSIIRAGLSRGGSLLSISHFQPSSRFPILTDPHSSVLSPPSRNLTPTIHPLRYASLTLPHVASPCLVSSHIPSPTSSFRPSQVQAHPYLTTHADTPCLSVLALPRLIRSVREGKN